MAFSIIPRRKQLEEDERKKRQEEARNRILGNQAATQQKPKPPVKKEAGLYLGGRDRAINKMSQKQNEFHQATDDKYNIAKNGLQARQNIKSGLYQSDPNVQKWNVDNHKVSTSLGRGFLGGVTFGASDLIAKRGITNKANKDAERYYQENKSGGAELVGNLAGSLAGFGTTSSLSTKAVKATAKKLAPKATKNISKSLTSNVAKSKLIRKVAEKEAYKKFGNTLGKEALEDVVQQNAKRRAKNIAKEIATDMAINVTTGAISDVNNALVDSKNGKEFAKNMGINAATNLGLGAVSSVAPSLIVKKTLHNGIVPKKTLRETAEEAVEANAKRALPRRAVPLNEQKYVHAYEREKGMIPKKLPPRKAVSTDEVVKAIDGIKNAPPVIEGKAKTPLVTEGNAKRISVKRVVNPVEAESNIYNQINKKYQLDDEPLVPTGRMDIDDNEVIGSVSEGTKKMRDAVEESAGEWQSFPKKASTAEQILEGKTKYYKNYNKDDVVALSKVASSQLHSMGSDEARAINDRLINSGILNYEKMDISDFIKETATEMHDDIEGSEELLRYIMLYNDDTPIDLKHSKEWAARSMYVMTAFENKLHLDESYRAAYEQAYKLLKDISSSSAQNLSLRRWYVHLSPSARVDSVLDDLAKMLDSSVGYRNLHGDLPNGKYDRLAAIKAELLEDQDIRSLCESLMTGVSEDDVTKIATELLVNVNRKNPKVVFDWLQEIRYLNMLGNPKTHIRNILGSAVFSPLRQITNTLRNVLEEYVSNRTGVEITRSGGMSLETFLDARRKVPKGEGGIKAVEVLEECKHELLGESKLSKGMLYKGRSNSLFGKFIDRLADFNSRLLAKEDDFYKIRSFRENFANSYNYYLKQGAEINDALIERMKNKAMQEARIATFSEYNELASVLTSISKNAQDANAPTWKRIGGMAFNAVMPFEKVPTNIAKQSINYSPIGILKGFMNITKAANANNPEMLSLAIDQLSSGLTGSAIMGLGAFFGTKTDLFTTNAGKDDFGAKFKKQQGVQNFSVMVTNPVSNKRYSLTFDWLSPSAVPFFVGVEFANQFKANDFNLLEMAGDWSMIFSRVIEPVFETTMMSGVYNIIDTMRSGYGEDGNNSPVAIIGREIGQSYINSFIPTIFGQTARTLYSTDKQISGKNDWGYFGRSIQSKMGLGGDNAVTRTLGLEPLGADTDAYGNVKGQKASFKEEPLNAFGDYAFSVFKNFLSPANISEVNLSEHDYDKLRQYDEDLRNGMEPSDAAFSLPRKQSKRELKINDELVELTPTELSLYNQAKTTGGEEGMRYLLGTSIFNRKGSGLNDKQKRQLMLRFKGKSMRELEEWLYKQSAFKTATEDEKRHIVSGIWNLSKAKAQASQRVGEQAVYKAKGKSVDEYNFANEINSENQAMLKPYIDSGLITHKEAVDFYRNATNASYNEYGTPTARFTKGNAIKYIVSNEIPFEKASVLYNALKSENHKPYDGTGSASGGSGGSGGSRRRRGGSSRAVRKPPKPKKITGLKNGVTLPAAKTSSYSASSTPKLERVKIKRSLPKR